MDSLTPTGQALHRTDAAEGNRADGTPVEVPQGFGLTEAQERTLRTQLALRLNDLIQERSLSQTAVAGIFGIPQPHISELRHYKLNRFSSERLLRFITLLDRDVQIVIRPKAEHHGAGLVSVMVAA